MQLGPVAITLEAIGITLVRMCVCVCVDRHLWLLCYAMLSVFKPFSCDLGFLCGKQVSNLFMLEMSVDVDAFIEGQVEQISIVCNGIFNLYGVSTQ